MRPAVSSSESARDVAGLHFDVAAHPLRARHPGVERVATGRHARNLEAPGLVAQREGVVLEHHHVGDHARVDVAVDGHEAWALECDAARGIAPLVLAEVEGMELRDGEHVVVDAVAVRERHRLSGDDREDARAEALAALHQLRRLGGRSAREARQVDDHAGVVVGGRGCAEERPRQHAHLALDHSARLRARARRGCEQQHDERERAAGA